MLAVVDTNVLISGLLTTHSPPARIVDQIFIGRIKCLYDDRILSEYRQVLARPKFIRAIAEQDSADLLDYLTRSGHAVLAEPLSGLAHNPPDLDDLPFAEVAAAGRAHALITGNVVHFDFFRDNPWKVKVLSPRETYELLCT